MVNDHSLKRKARILMADSQGALSYTGALRLLERSGSSQMLSKKFSTSVLTVEDSLRLSDCSVIYRVDALGSLLGIGVRHQFTNSGPNKGKWGWMISSETDEESAEKFISGDLLSDVLFSSALFLLEDGSVLIEDFDGEPYLDEEAEDSAYELWRNRGIQTLARLPIGAILVDAEGDPIGVKGQSCDWQILSCSWTSDDDAVKKYFSTSVLLKGPSFRMPKSD